jgi:hypothetical protein
MLPVRLSIYISVITIYCAEKLCFKQRIRKVMLLWKYRLSRGSRLLPNFLLFGLDVVIMNAGVRSIMRNVVNKIG